MKEIAKILIAKHNNVAWIKIQGDGSHANSGNLNSLIHKLNKISKLKKYVFDFENCSQVDSTFVGSIIGNQMKIREMKKNKSFKFYLVNVNDRIIESLNNLGLAKLLAINPQNAEIIKLTKKINNNLTEAQTIEQSNDDRRKVVLEAHQALANINSENSIKFYDVIHFIKG